MNTCIDPEKINTIRKLMEGSVQEILNNGNNVTVKVMYYVRITEGQSSIKSIMEVWHEKGHLKMMKLIAGYIVFWS